jgi:hypothetical protein
MFSIKGRLAMGTIGLGTSLVSGIKREPTPAAIIIAFKSIKPPVTAIIFL